jgi:murein DD-endopeptidase MepM/ murein hydrolase activator NlpD
MSILLALILALVSSFGYGWPVEPPHVARGFDPPPQPWLAGHRGVDLAATPAAPVRAAGAGVVAFAGVIAGRGVVSVAHPGGLRTTYEPVLSALHVGDPVARGQVLGTLAVGHPGCPVAACLHWGLRRGDEYLDPLALLGLGRVRLLPLAGAGT